MRAWGSGLALALLLAAAIPTGAALAAENAEQVLLDKANYWRIKDRPELAAEALNKLHDFGDIFYSHQFLEPRPLLRALQQPDGAVLLIDEVDKSDQE